MQELVYEVTAPFKTCYETAAGTQLSLALEDAWELHHCDDKAGWRGFGTLNYRDAPDAILHEKRFQIDVMPLVIEDAFREMPDHDLFLSQNSFSGARNAATLLSINAGYIDLDIYNTSWIEHDKDFVCAQVLAQLDARGIPRPSYIIDSGRGLQIKWIFTEPISPGALPLWVVTHRYLVEEILAEFGADIAAILATQIMRVVGSKNLKNGQTVRKIWPANDREPVQKISFSAWSAAILPYSREDVRKYKAEKKANRTQYLQWCKENEANLQRLAEDNPARARHRAKPVHTKIDQLPGLDISPAAIRAIEDLEVGEVWSRRLELIPRLLKLRGLTEPAEGTRHKFVWVIANALAWVNRDHTGSLKTDLLAYAKQWVPSYSEAEVLSAAASVLTRSKQKQGWNSGIYKMGETKFREHLMITPEERAALGNGKYKKSENWSVGSMQLPKMRGLKYDEYVAEVRTRQQAAAARTNEMMQAASAQLRERAFAMHEVGTKQKDIAVALGVSRQAISKWLKSK